MLSLLGVHYNFRLTAVDYVIPPTQIPPSFWQCQDFESAFYRNPSLTEQVAFTERITLTERMTLTPECMDLTERMALTDLKISNGTFSQGEPLLFSMVSRYFL